MKPAARLKPEPELAAKADSKPKPLAVAPAKKHTVKTDRPVDDDDPREGPSPKSEAKASSARSEANIDSFSLKDLRSLRKDYRRQPDESIIIMKREDIEETVLDIAKKLRAYADAVHGPTHAKIAAVETRLQKLEDKIDENHKKLREEIREDLLQISAVQIRSSSSQRRRSPARERGYTPRAELWFFLRDCRENMNRWDRKSTAALAQRPSTSEPQKYEALVDTSAQCTLLPSRHVGEESVSIAEVTGSSQEFTLVEADVSLTENEWKRHPVVTGPEAPCILGIDFLRNEYFKDPKGFKWAFGIAAVETESVKQLNTLPRLSENPSAVSLLKVEEQQVPIATSIVHRRQYRTTRDAMIPIHKMIRELESQGVENTAAEVFEKGKKIIQILLEASFAIKKSKVKGPAHEIQFLKIKWQDGQRQIPTEVINKITAMSPPTNKKETQAFLSAIGFWKMHIPEYSQIVSPLYLVTRKKNNFHWGPEQQQAFAQIKQEIAHAVALGPVSTGPDVKNVLYSAASNNGLS
ncbi:hypothetical protein DUI87_10530 [Hirundo rustica rustica]|uniref:Reverse transcriptase/retrotransposon-derived protein RNase H-like domain-containing protein n=1 Tax=Hirundo rustica rustica TaxID=333673 RepID=A0A3M0KK34_HIRRU|nr:hypothetical protein DUI87_10530 [Hirundo rustica rustica]